MANNHINRGTDHCVPPGGQPALASLQLYLESYFLLSTLIKSFVTVSDHYCTSYPLTNEKFHPWLRAGRTNTILSNHDRNDFWVSAAHNKNFSENTPEKKLKIRKPGKAILSI